MPPSSRAIQTPQIFRGFSAHVCVTLEHLFFKRQNVEEKSAENLRKNGRKNLRTKNLPKNGCKNLRTKNLRNNGRKNDRKNLRTKSLRKNRFEHSVCLEDGRQKKKKHKKICAKLAQNPSPKSSHVAPKWQPPNLHLDCMQKVYLYPCFRDKGTSAKTTLLEITLWRYLPKTYTYISQSCANLQCKFLCSEDTPRCVHKEHFCDKRSEGHPAKTPEVDMDSMVLIWRLYLVALLLAIVRSAAAGRLRVAIWGVQTTTKKGAGWACDSQIALG